MIGADPRQETLILSLQKRYAAADSRDDAEAKRALFKEAVYLNILPDLLDPERTDTSPIDVSNG
jgi:hypothetical protein